MATHQNTGGTVVSSYTYAVNPISQRTSVTTASIVFAGSNSIVECSVHPSTFNLHHSFSWDIDLSGTMQGAGGVGGLLATRWVSTGNADFFPTYDGNGNVSEYLATNGTVTVHYEYDPFGTLTRLTGSTSTRFSYRFSTKPRDAATGLYYYGYRWYEPYTGRWINRDSIEESGGVNLYGMVGNDGVNLFDVLGQQVFPLTHKPVGCTVTLFVGHGAVSHEESDAGEYLREWSMQRDIESGYDGNGRRNIYARASALGCNFSDWNEDGLSIEGILPATHVPIQKADIYKEYLTRNKGNHRVGQTGLYTILSNDQAGPWNAGFNGPGGDMDKGATAQSALKYLNDSWTKAVKQGDKLATDCGQDPTCCCKNILVRIYFSKVGRNPASNIFPKIRDTYERYRVKPFPLTKSRGLKNFREEVIGFPVSDQAISIKVP